MAKGKCWIYRQATLHVPNLPPRLLDYSDGTVPFDCDNVYVSQGQYPVYMWNLPGEQIPIPLNIPRYETESIIRQGMIPYAGGELRWEFIFGKYKTYSQYYMNKIKDCLPYIIVIFILIMIQNGKGIGGKGIGGNKLQL